MLLTITYQAIVALMAVLSVWNLFREKDIRQQAAYVLVICPLILRLLMIK